MSTHGDEQRARVAELFELHAGNVSAIARDMDLTRMTVRMHIAKLGLGKKPLAGGKLEGTQLSVATLPGKGLIKRYLLTSAQNNTHVNQKVWINLLALADWYSAELMIGTFSYNTNAYGEMAVKRGTKKEYQKVPWYDPLIKEFISDERIELAHGLVWCGEMNILPTAEDPLSGLETYTHRKSGIFPHSKISMRSIATMQGEGTKFNYTTGTVTLANYIQKKAGLKAEHHHAYGALLVEVDCNGNWWVRQICASGDGRMQDLDVMADNGGVTDGHPIEAITFGDLHATMQDSSVLTQSMDMIDVLKPKYQFLHDVLEGVAINHHTSKDPHQKFKAHIRGLDKFTNELVKTISTIQKYERESSKLVVVDSNHDSPWIYRWLREHDYRQDPANALLFLRTQLAVYEAIDSHDDKFHPLEYLLKGQIPDVMFLRTDQSFVICGKKIECGMHGHLGPDGARGTPRNLKRVGRRANTAHTHSCGIYDGLYVAGTSTKLKWDYAKGPSSWSHSHILTYPNGMRSIVTMFNGQWRATCG